MINWDKVRELRDDIGAEDFNEIIEVFLEEVETELAELSNKPTSELGASMHFLKGSALNLGFEEFSEKCHAGEKMAADNRAEFIDLADVQASYAASKEKFLENCTKI